MRPEYWFKQDQDKPLFPDILWEKPERRDLAGRILVIGGSLHGLHAVAEAYQSAIDAGIGEAHVLVPDSLRKVTKHVPSVVYAQSNAIGSFSVKARDDLLAASQAVDGVILAGDFGRNSETAILLAEFLKSYNGLLGITKDAVDSLYSETKRLLEREKTLLGISFGQLQRIAKEAEEQKAFLYATDFIPLIEKLHDFTVRHPVFLLTKHHDQMLAAYEGRVATMPRLDLQETWCTSLTARAVTYLIHHPQKSFEALASSLL